MDVFLLNGPIYETTRKKVTNLLDNVSSRRANAFISITTLGGDPHEAYVIARSFQEQYSNLTFCITGDCFSAGTLIAVSGEELVFGKRGHLGPLDIQVRKKDEFLEHSSGMVMATSLDELEQRALDCMNKFTDGVWDHYEGQVTMRTSMEHASELTKGLFGPLYSQIDPRRIGEDRRAMQIMEHYGKRLSKRPKNLLPDGLKRLLESYPDHGCYIDFEEAGELFRKVRRPSSQEEAFVGCLNEISDITENRATRTVVLNLSADPPTTQEENNEQTNGTGEAKPEGTNPSTGANPKNGDGATTTGTPGPNGKATSDGKPKQPQTK